MAELSESVRSIGKAFGAIFRHLLPGVLVLSAAAVARPSWFLRVDVTRSEWLVILGVLAIVTGNVWFVLHRYFVQQLIDVAFWFFKFEGSPKRGETQYHSGVAEHVWSFFSASAPEDVREHLRFRTSSVVLMYISSEVALLAVLLAEETSIVAGKPRWLLLTGVLIFVGAVWQNYLTRRIELRVANGAPNTALQTDERRASVSVNSK